MAVTAKLRYLRIAPRKVRLVADLIRGKKVEEAQTILNFVNKKAAKPLLKLLKSGMANAFHNFQLDPKNLYISKIKVDEGPKYKRWIARARGMVSEIQKKTSHVTLELEEIEKGRKKKIIPQKKKEEVKKIEEELKEKKKIEEKPKFKPKTELEIAKPKIKKGIKKFFRRKAF